MPQLSPVVNFSPSPAGKACLLMLKWSLPIELCLSQYSQYNGYVTNVILLSSTPTPHLLQHWNVALWQCSSLAVGRSCSAVHTLYQSGLVRVWETWFSVEKMWQPLPTNTSGCQAALCSSDWMTGLNAAVSTNRSSDRKASAPRFSNIIPFPYICHQRRQQELKEQPHTTFCKVRGMHNIQFMFGSS